MNKWDKFSQTHAALIKKVDLNIAQIKMGLTKIQKILNRK